MGKELREQDELMDETFGKAGDPNPNTVRVGDEEGEEGDEATDAPEGQEQGSDGEQAGGAGQGDGEEGGEGSETEEPEAREDDIDDFLQDRVDVGSDEGDEDSGGDEGEESGGQGDEGGDEISTELEALDLDEERFEEVTSSPEAFAQFISETREEVYNKALGKAREEMKQEIANAKQEILQNIPQVVQKSAKRAQSVEQHRQQFFKDNPALQKRLGYVKDMTSVVASKNPDWSAKQVLDEVAKRAKRDLNLSEQADEREKQRKSDPKFAGAGGRQAPGGGQDNRTSNEKMLDQTFGPKQNYN